MRKKQILLFSLLCLAAYGCGSKGSSSMEMPNNSIMNGVTLTNSKQGQAVGLVDVDGDGIADKVVGAPYATTSTKMGAVIVYKGTKTGFSSSPTSVLTGDDNYGTSFIKLEKGSKDASEQFAIASMNGDGADVSLSGSVSIYKAGSNGPQLVAKISGEGPLDKFGLSLAAGDVNGDGYTDIIVGAPFNTNDPSVYQQGAVYVFLGPNFTTKKALYATSSAKGLGWAVAAGDINGDGIADLLISATGSGKVLGFYGSASFAPAMIAPDVTITGSAAGFGKAIAVVGDIDGDTYKDIAIGAPNAVINVANAGLTTANRDTGSVYVIKGGTGSRTVNANNTSADRIAQINGGALFDRFGSSIAAVGDVDGDGKADFAVGAATADVTTAGNDISGKVYLFKGKDINSSTTLANSTAFAGSMKDQAYGTFVTPAGSGKLLIGAPGSNMNTGGVSMMDLSTGMAVPGGSSGGTSGDGGSGCGMPGM